MVNREGCRETFQSLSTDVDKAASMRNTIGELEELNSKLDKAKLSSQYSSVKVLVLYWAEGIDIDTYQTEGQKLGTFFEEDFGFAVDFFPIPLKHSYTKLHGKVLSILEALEDSQDDEYQRSLLIIHYGGHGDMDDDRRQGEQRRAVWGPERYSTVKVEWWKIQQSFVDVKVDIVMLLDCCHAAQAGRGHDGSTEGHVELLAAAAMDIETPPPGQHSFTQLMIDCIKNNFLNKGKSFEIQDLHAELLHRRARLYATPVYARILSGHGGKNIRIEPLGHTKSIDHRPSQWKSAVRLVVRVTEHLDSARIDQLVRWLRTDAPELIAELHAEEILSTTTRITECIKNSLVDDQKPLFKDIDAAEINKMEAAWSAAQISVKQYTAEHQALTSVVDESTDIERSAELFVEKMRSYNSKVLEAIETSVLRSASKADDRAIADAIEDKSSETLGIKDKLVIRSLVSAGSSNATSVLQPTDPRGQYVEEYKFYREHANDYEIKDIRHRVQLLAGILSADKRDAFRSLRLVQWEHDPIRHRFVYRFQVPFDSTHKYMCMRDAISGTRGAARPSLGERFALAIAITRAVQHWHSVDWVHQSISAHNILVFYKVNEKMKWESPFLQGFDFARPNELRSAPTYVEDVDLDVYRHPSRHGPVPARYRKIHDLYSLGVVLMELGLWQHASDIIRGKGSRKVTLEEMTKRLREAAHSRLAHYAGRDYRDAVLTCLTGNFGVKHGDELADPFQRKVVDKLTPGSQIR